MLEKRRTARELALPNRRRATLVAIVLGSSALVPSAAVSDRGGSLFSSGLSEQELIRELKTAEPRQFKPVGHSSVAFRMRLKGSTTAMYKVSSRAFPKPHRAEVAAYRVGRALGLDNVPPAVLRLVSRDTIEARMHRGSKRKWQTLRGEVNWSENGSAMGVASAWVSGLRSLRLEHSQSWWRPWLRVDGKIPKQRVALARDLSNMVVFDYLIGNPDRFSGRNMKVLPRAGRLIMLDHDQAFPETPESHSDFLLKSLQMTTRFSRKLIECLHAMNEAQLRAKVGPSRSLLTDDQIKEVLKRRGVVLSYVAELREKHSTDAVLFFE